MFNTALSCPAVGGHPAYTGSLRGDIRAAASAVVTVGVAAVGTVIPPELTEFGVFAATEASFNGILTLSATATVSFRLRLGRLIGRTNQLFLSGQLGYRYEATLVYRHSWT